MLVHYMDSSDSESIAEVDVLAYYNVLRRYSSKFSSDFAGLDVAQLQLHRQGCRDLAIELRRLLTIVNNDPKVSEFDACDVFFSYSDVFIGFISADNLLDDLSADILNVVKERVAHEKAKEVLG